VSLKEVNYLFPLYLYPEERDRELFAVADDGSAWPLSARGRRPNLNPAFVAEMGARLGLEFVAEGQGDLAETFGPEDVFHYAYAVFHSPTYRERYAEFLKIDFAPAAHVGCEPFAALCQIEAELAQLHLMMHPALDQLMTTHPEKGQVVAAAIQFRTGRVAPIPRTACISIKRSISAMCRKRFG
jgi:predicted helicase